MVQEKNNQSFQKREYFLEKIKEFILTEICEDLGLDIPDISANDPLIELRILDSLGILKLISFLDEDLEIDISSEEIRVENFVNLRTIMLLVENSSGIS